MEGLLTPGELEGIFDGIHPRRLDLSLPRFRFEFPIPLKETLGRMGMLDAFSELLADFSGIDGSLRLLIQNVHHKGFVGVDEAGTEAAAATAVVIGDESEPPRVAVDRPFLFLIRDIPTRTVLFLGRVSDPTEPGGR